MCLPILYSFRRCPYAIRARMALGYADIPYELREISLKNKPREMLEISPKGTTPVMQIFREARGLSPLFNGSTSSQDFIVLEESLDIMRWALQQHDPLNWGNLSDEDLAIANQLISTNDHEFKQALDRYKYANRFPERSPEFYRQQAEEFLQILEQRLGESHKSRSQSLSKFLIGDRQTFADIAIFPFVRQLAYVDIEWFNSSPYLHLQNWLRWHESSALFELVMQKFPVWESGYKV